MTNDIPFAHQNGDCYYCVQRAKPEKEIYVMADYVEFLPSGGVLFIHGDIDGTRIINLALAHGQWKFIFSASMLDGKPVATKRIHVATNSVVNQ